MDVRPQPPGLREPARPRPRRARPGFTLIEMMVLVAILAVLGLATVPRFMQGVYRSRRVEALYALRTTHDLQTTYYANHDAYSGSFEELGVPLAGATLREDGTVASQEYTLTLDTWSLGGHEDANYRATATGNIDPTDDTLDIVIIENELTVKD